MPVCIIQNKLQFSLQNLPKLFDPVLSLSLTQTVWSCALLITARIPLQTVYSIDNIHHINCCPCERHAILPKSLARCHSTGPNFVSILYIHTYICTYIHTDTIYVHTIHGSVSVSQRQQDAEQVINTQIYTTFTVPNTITIYKAVLQIIFT